MQLNHPPSISAALSLAACALLGLPAQAAEQNPWDLDATVLLYSEKDRVTAVEPVFNAARRYSDERLLNLRLTLDTLTGPSPNGASPTNTAQTFTRPSGSGSYTVPANETPLDDTFRDTRIALNAQWQQPLDRLWKGSAGANISAEHDYYSLGINGTLARDLNKRNTTLSVGVALSEDLIQPEGGIPTPRASMQPFGMTQPRDGDSDTKRVSDVLFGLTQVINRRTLMQFNYGVSESSGYNTDPFKILSVVDGSTGQTLDYVYEYRPDSRLKHSFYWQTKYHLTADIVDASYRYMTDDWGIASHTLDFHYRWQFSDKDYLQPHLRYYSQSAADFYYHSLVQGRVPEHASADYRLAKFDGVTLGLKYGHELPRGQNVSLRIEYYQQRGDSHPADAVGIQKNQDLYQGLDAYLIQFSYSF